MRRLVDRLLDVSQLASGRLALDLAPNDLGRVVKEVAERFSEDASNARCEFLNSGPQTPVGDLASPFILAELDRAVNLEAW